MREYDEFVSASVITECLDTGKYCDFKPVVTHMRHRELNEAKRLKKFSRFRAPDSNRSPDPKEMFHIKYLSLLKNGLESVKDSDAVASVLFKEKSQNKRFEITPTIRSEEFHIIGAPDIIFYSENCMHIVELKDRKHLTFYKTDKMQVETYMTIEKSNRDSDLKIHEMGLEGKEIRGSLLYNNGSLVPVILENEALIKSTALKTLSNIRRFKSVFDLPEPKKCNPDCENLTYCSRRKGMNYESIITSPGRIEVQSPFYSQRA